MKRTHSHLIMVVALVGLAIFGASEAAGAPLACDVLTATECQITTLKNLGAGGTFGVDRTLHIGPTGELRTNPGSTLTLAITGDLIVNSGGKITGNAAASGNSSGATIAITTEGSITLDGSGSAGALISVNQPQASCSGGKGGTISLTSNLVSAGASITTGNGSKITANARCSAGEIKISATRGGVDIGGVVESVSTLTGVGPKQPPGGGPISITASCDLTIDDTGRVSSKGSDPGADLVHLAAGGDVRVYGLVESTGPGHVVPTTPKNHCAGPDRADKPENATACVEIWAGKSLTIDGTGTNHGEINADTPRGGRSGIGWVDVFAKGNITIAGRGTGPYAANAQPYAVHSNQAIQNSQAGIIAVKSVQGQVSLAGQAIQADTPQGGGGAGGSVSIEAGGASLANRDVNLGTASVRARGANSGGGPQAGGEIIVQSFSGRVVGASPGELNAAGGGGKPVPAPGSVTLQGCEPPAPAVAYAGTVTGALDVEAPSCGGTPSLPGYVVFPTSECDIPIPCTGPDCACTGPDCPCTGPDCPCTGPNCPCTGPNCPCTGPDCPCTGPDCPCTGPNCPCTGPDCPCTGPDCPCTGPDCPCTGPNCPCTGPNCPCTGPNCPCTGPDCPCTGAGCQPYTSFCDKGTVKAVLDPLTGRFPGNLGADVVVDVRTQSLQAAIDAASDVNNDGYIIIGVIAKDGGLSGGTGQQEVEVSQAYGKPFAMIACGVTVLDPLVCNGTAVVRVRSSATSPEFPVGSGVTLYFQDLTVMGSKSAPGWVVEGDGRLLQGIGSQSNTDGVRIVGNRNTIRNGYVSQNFNTGLVVQGDGNTVDSVKATSNSASDGIRVTGNNNTIANNTAGDQGQGNGGSGIKVSGVGNLVQGNGAFANYGNGITIDGGVAAAPNIVKSNVAGGPQRGNSNNGMSLSGTGAGPSGVIDIVGNIAQSNVLGISVSGTGHRLKDNASGGGAGAANVACQFWVAPLNFNATGNSRNLAPIAGVDGAPFPTGCF